MKVSLLKDYEPPLQFISLDDIDVYHINDIVNFLQLENCSKIALLEVNYSNLSKFDQLLEQVCNCDSIIVYSMELTSSIVQLMKKYDRSNFVFVVNGTVNQPIVNAQVHAQLNWLISTAAPYQSMFVDLLKQNLAPFAQKKYKFEVMYGRKRDHRMFVHNLINQSTLSEHFFQTPFFDNTDDSDRRSLVTVESNYNIDLNDLWEDDMVVEPPPNNYHCIYHGHRALISQIVPFKIYKQSMYSLVCETRYANDYSFFTEKIAKPIVGQRLFIVISGQHYLKNLRALGFKTFGSIIDESYDDVEDNEQRWKYAIEQAVGLCSRDPVEVFGKLVPIVLHNYDMLKRLDNNVVTRCVEIAALADTQ